MTFWDDDLGHDEITTAIDKIYDRLIIDAQAKNARRSHDDIVFGVRMRQFVSLVCDELREQQIRFKVFAIRTRCESRLRDKYLHPTTPRISMCTECGRIYPKHKTNDDLIRTLRRRFEIGLVKSECCNPTPLRRICAPIFARNILCGARLVGTADGPI